MGQFWLVGHWFSSVFGSVLAILTHFPSTNGISVSLTSLDEFSSCARQSLTQCCLAAESSSLPAVAPFHFWCLATTFVSCFTIVFISLWVSPLTVQCFCGFLSLHCHNTEYVFAVKSTISATFMCAGLRFGFKILRWSLDTDSWVVLLGSL